MTPRSLKSQEGKGDMKEYKFLKTKQVNAALWVKIHNPPVNFLTTDILAELYDLTREVRKDNSIRVFILTGGIEDHYVFHFSIPELEVVQEHNRKILMSFIFRTRLGRALMQSNQTLTMKLMDWFPMYETAVMYLAEKLRNYSSTLHLWFVMQRCYLAIERMNKITIAAINGSCNGGGTEISTCFDFRFMINDRNFTIGQLEVILGIVPGGGGNCRLPRLIGKAKALELMLTGGIWTPEEAKKNSLITDCFPKNKFHSKIQDFADRISRYNPVAVDEIKKTVHQGMDATLLHSLSIEMGASVKCFDDDTTQKILEEYNRLLKARVEAPKEKQSTIQDVVAEMNTDEMQQRHSPR